MHLRPGILPGIYSNNARLTAVYNPSKEENEVIYAGVFGKMERNDYRQWVGGRIMGN